jgi:hypothetical protein
MKNPSRASRPLETGRDWVIAVLGLGAFAVVGYLAEGHWVSGPLIFFLVVLVGALVKRYRHEHKEPD